MDISLSVFALTIAANLSGVVVGYYAGRKDRHDILIHRGPAIISNPPSPTLPSTRALDRLREISPVFAAAELAVAMADDDREALRAQLENCAQETYLPGMIR